LYNATSANWPHSYRTTLKQQTDDSDASVANLKACHKRCAERTLIVLEKNGSIFIKLGQHLSSMGYLLPYEWTTTFVPLQDKCPVSSYESIEDMFLKDTGHRIDEDFDDFSREPIGAASLAQVHTAVLKNTQRKVAVKVQHPTLAEWVPLDLALTRFTFSTLKRVFPEYDLSWLSDEMEFSLPQELDFTLEGANALFARDYFRKNTNFPLIIPDVISSSRRILVMDYVTGCRPDNLAYLDAHNISRDEVSATLARIFNTMIFTPNAPLHCDPHGGNIAIRPNPTRRYPYNFDVVLYDHGLYRIPDTKLRRDYAKLWLAVLDADEARMRKYAFEVAGITDEQFPLFASAITGRDYRVLTRKGAAGVASTARDVNEKHAINNAFGEGLLQQLVQLLGTVPRIILLILKTNDLTRSLDEGLQTRQGPERTFLILAKYASRAVWDEEYEGIRNRRGAQLGRLWWAWPGNFVRLLFAWGRFIRVEVKLWGYERYLATRRLLGVHSP
jgi:aarF domain-containing kinase